MKILKTSLITLSLLSTPFAAYAQARWVTPDFVVVSGNTKSSFTTFHGGIDTQDCRSSISSAVCLVDPQANDEIGKDRACLAGSETYAKYFETLYDQFPSHLQRMFCHLKKIYVEKEFIGSAYAGVLTEGNQEDGRIIGGVLGVRKSLLDQPVTLAEWASWKEQIHFGTDPHQVNFVAGLPIVHSDMPGGQTDMLYFLVAHEFGHIFDFTNKLNENGSWQAMSWKDGDVPLEQFEFSLRKELCFYFCEGKFISQERQDELYEALGKTNFISAYATRYSAEDFADTLAFYTLMAERNASYRIATASGLIYDPMERLRADPSMASKREYIENFLKSNYRYPGEDK